jgi:NADPH:quinone reductase-like Zn-dependent oxidoreductase
MSRRVVLDRTGAPEVLRIEQFEVGEPGPGEVRIRVDAIGLNRAEVLFRAGRYWLEPKLPGSRLGHEASGVVEAIGADVSGFEPGDEVSTVTIEDMSTHGVYGDQVIVPASALIRRPPGTDAVTAAATWLAYTTAYGALVETAGIRSGERVLITAAAGAVGIAAIRVANRLGAIPVAVTRSKEKRNRLLELGAAEVITGDSLGTADVVLDAVAGSGLDTLALALAPGGRLVVTSNLDPAPTPLPWVWPLTLYKYANPVFYATDPARLTRAQHFIETGLRAGDFAPVVDRTYDLEEIVAAHHHLESNTHVGKLVVTVTH